MLTREVMRCCIIRMYGIDIKLVEVLDSVFYWYTLTLMLNMYLILLWVYI